MGHRQPWLVDRLGAVEQQVEVDRPRPPARAVAHAAELALDLEQPLEQLARGRPVSSSATAFRKRGWSVSPHGSVSRIVESRARADQLRRPRGSTPRGRRGSPRARRRPDVTSTAARALTAVTAANSSSTPAGRTPACARAPHPLGRGSAASSVVGDRRRERLEQPEPAARPPRAPPPRPRGSRPRSRSGRRRRARRPRARRRRRTAGRAAAPPRGRRDGRRARARELDLHRAHRPPRADRAAPRRARARRGRAGSSRRARTPRRRRRPTPPSCRPSPPGRRGSARASSCARSRPAPAARSRPARQPAHELEVVLDRLPEADAGVEADELLADPRRDREREPLLEERLHLGDDVVVDRVGLHRARLAAHVHQAEVGARVGDHPGELRVAAQRRHVVDELGAELERPRARPRPWPCRSRRAAPASASSTGTTRRAPRRAGRPPSPAGSTRRRRR